MRADIVPKFLQTFGLFSGSKLLASRVLAKHGFFRSSKVLRLKYDGGELRARVRIGSSDWWVLQQVFIEVQYHSGSHYHESLLSDMYRRILEKGKKPLILDCGANIGLTSLWYANRFPDATIVAVEPEPENFDLLEANTAQLPNVSCIRGAVHDVKAVLKLVNSGQEPWTWSTQEGDPLVASSRENVKSVLLSDILRDTPNAIPLIVKIDIEGAEAGLFRSNTSWVRSFPLIAVELHDWRFPRSGIGGSVLTELLKEPRDYVVRGEVLFAFATFSDTVLASVEPVHDAKPPYRPP